MAFLKNLFFRSGKTAKPSSPPISQSAQSIEKMSLVEILEHISRTDTFMSGTMVALSRRLYEIALYDHNIPMRDRETALKLVESCDRDIEAGLANNPEALRAFREATTLMKERAKFFGFGSLPWLLEENHVPTEDVIPFVMRKEHAHLLKNAMHAFDTDFVAKAKPEMVRELIRTRRPPMAPNGVLVLHGLAHARDPASEALFTDSELRTLREAHLDYASARNVLVALSVLPTASGAKPFEPLSHADLGQLVLLMLKEEWDDQDKNPEMAAYLKSVDEDWRQRFLQAVWRGYEEGSRQVVERILGGLGDLVL